MQYEAFQHMRDGIGEAVMRSHERGIAEGVTNYGWPSMTVYRDRELAGTITWGMLAEDEMGAVEQVMSTVLLFGGSLCKADDWLIHLPMHSDDDTPMSCVSCRSVHDGEGFDEVRHYTEVGGETFAGEWEPLPDIKSSHDSLNMMMRHLIPSTTDAQRLVTYTTLNNAPGVRMHLAPDIQAEIDELAANFDVATEAAETLASSMNMAHQAVQSPELMDEARKQVGLPTRAELREKLKERGKEDE